MSVQKLQYKQQLYSDFNHFLSQLIRGKFGVLSECAKMVTQHDPIVAASAKDKSIYKPKNNIKMEKKNVKIIENK